MEKTIHHTVKNKDADPYTKPTVTIQLEVVKMLDGWYSFIEQKLGCEIFEVKESLSILQFLTY